MTSVAERIRFLRGSLSREEFASNIGIKPTTLRNYELNVSLPHADVLANLCVNLNINPAWLLLGLGEQQADNNNQHSPHLSSVCQQECPTCELLTQRLTCLEEERKSLVEEVRQANADHRRLWQDHGDLLKNLAASREESATLRERLVWVGKSTG